MGEAEHGPEETELDGNGTTTDNTTPQMPETQTYQSSEGGDFSVAGGSSGGGNVENSKAPSQAEIAKQAGQKVSAAPKPTTPAGGHGNNEEIEAAREVIKSLGDELNVIGGPTGSK